MKKFFLIILFIILNTISYGKNDATIDWLNSKIISIGDSNMAIDEEGNPVDVETNRALSISEARNISYERSRERALVNAINTISTIQVDNEKKIADLIKSDPTVRKNIYEIIEKNSTYKDVTSNYLVSSCKFELNTGYLTEAINYNFPKDNFPIQDNIEISTLYSSIIIDVRGLGIKPMLIPSIINESGLEVYNKNFINPDDAVKYSVVSYVYNEKDAIKHKKAGKNPLFCVALKNINGNPVISDDDIKKIFSHKKNIEYLKRCRVIFIIDRL
ncbi:MAG: hypothetical protein FWH53_03150 [Leptospirales bacterium]|nr:hypothetical protein [Leptospirales bacterium]